MGRRAESREALSHLAIEATRYREARNTARSEALIRAERQVEVLKLEFQRQIFLAVKSGHAISAIADAASVGRSTIYKWMEEYALVAPTEIDEVVENNPWSVGYFRDGQWRIAHPVLGTYLAQFEQADDSLTIWREAGVYKPISREHDDISEDGPWDNEYELVYTSLVDDRDRWVAAGSPAIWDDAGIEPVDDEYAVSDLDFLGADE